MEFISAMDNGSAYHFYSLGIASNNKELKSDTLFVYPVEVMPFGDGELDGRNIDRVSEGTDQEGRSYTARVNENSAVEALWARVGQSNRRYPPDVRRGERILLYRHTDDSDKLFWSSCGLDDHRRRLETVVYTFSDTTDEDADATAPENCYSVEVCTHTKQITLRTVKADGEPFAYTFQFNLKDGAVILTDDVGNFIKLDSSETLISACNAEGAQFHLDRQDIFITAVKDLFAKAGQNMQIDVGANMQVEVVGDLTSKSVGNTRIVGQTTTYIGSPTHGIRCTPASGSLVGPRWDFGG